jgi:hypothetical protein
MDETQLKKWCFNLHAEDKTFVICGDQGINDVVQNDFGTAPKTLWSLILKTAISQGLIDGVLRAEKN